MTLRDAGAEIMPTIKAAAVFIGSHGLGTWQRQEIDVFENRFAAGNCHVIPLILPEFKDDPTLPVFLKSKTWVDFRKTDPDPWERLLYGITGRRGA